MCLNKFLLITNRYMPSCDSPIPSPPLYIYFPHGDPHVLPIPHLLFPSNHLHEATLSTATLQLQADASETTLLSLTSLYGHLLTPSSLLHNSPAEVSLSCHTIHLRRPAHHSYNILLWEPSELLCSIKSTFLLLSLEESTLCVYRSSVIPSAS